MKIEHKTEKGTVLFVKVPDDALGIYLSKTDDYGNSLVYKWYNEPCLLRLKVDGDWQLIGLTSDVTEEQARVIVDSKQESRISLVTGDVTFTGKSLYYFQSEIYDNALDSFKSLMQHLQVYEVNPYGRQPYLSIDDAGSIEETETRFLRTYAEKRTGKWIVLFKPNEK